MRDVPVRELFAYCGALTLLALAVVASAALA